MERLLDKYKIIILHITFFFLLLFVYLTYIVEVFKYEGFAIGFEDNFNPLKMNIAVVSIIGLASTVRKKGTPSHFFLHLALAMIVIPTMVLYCGIDLPNEFALLTLFSFILITITVNLAKFKTLKFYSIRDEMFSKDLVYAAILFVLSIFAFGGAQYLNFDFTLVYDFRDDAARNLPDIYGYLSPIFAKVIIPFAIVFALINKKWWLILLLTICSIMIFGLTTHKAPIFFPIIVLAVYWMAGKKNIAETLVSALIIFLVISELDFWLAEKTGDLIFGWVGNFYTERSILIPSLLNYFYFDFFSEHAGYYWSQSKVSLGLLDRPYPMNPEKLIGQIYITATDNASPNVGWIGSGFANAQYVGVFIYSILIGFYFSFLDAYSRKHGSRIVIALFTVPTVMMITSSDLTVMILTEGLILAIPLLMSISGDQYELRNVAPTEVGKSRLV